VSETLLAALFGKEGSETFLADHWPERWFHAHGSSTGLPAILRSPELRSLDVLAQRYAGTIAFGRGSVDARTMSADTHAGNLFKLGFTVYLADIAALLPSGPNWLAALERELGVTVGCSKIGAFASPRGDGLPCHFDAEDVISVQLSGSKIFEVAKVDDLRFPVGRQFGPGMLPADDLYPQASEGFPRPEGLEFEQIRMEPGSVLFMPRGTWHRSHAESDSWSISIGLRPPVALDYLLHQLRLLLLQEPEWRRPLYGVAYPDARRNVELQRIGDLLNELPSVLAQLSPTDLAPPVSDNSHRQAEQRREFLPIPMSEIRFAAANGRLQLTVSAWDHDWIERATLQTEVPLELEPALEWLAKRRAAFGAAEFTRSFPANSAENLDQLLDLLCKSKYLRRLWYPLLSREP
jgi:hypothetical protein